MVTPTLASIDKKVDLLANDFKHLKEDVNDKHMQNRKSIHTLTNSMQEMDDTITKFRINMAKYSVVAGILTGALTAAVVEVIKHAVK